MFVFIAAQMAQGITGAPMDCLAPLLKEEVKQSDAVGVAIRKAAGMLVLEPDEDLLPGNAPSKFKPALVVLSYKIGGSGSVSDCTVGKPSGISSLDTASCDLLRRHLRVKAGSPSLKPLRIAVVWAPPAFRPERRVCNTNGGAVPVSSTQWFVNNGFAGLFRKSGAALVSLNVAATGQITDCRIKLATVPEGVQRKLCEMLSERAIILPALNSEGLPKATTLLFVRRFAIR